MFEPMTQELAEVNVWPKHLYIVFREGRKHSLNRRVFCAGTGSVFWCLYSFYKRKVFRMHIIGFSLPVSLNARIYQCNVCFHKNAVEEKEGTHFMVTIIFPDMMLRRIFGPKRDEVIKEWRKLHNEELFDQYSLPNIVRVTKSRRMRWAGHVARIGEKRCVYRVLMGKPEGKRPLGRPRRRWEDNIR